MKRSFFIWLAVGFTSCYVGEELPPDQEVWEYAVPDRFGLDGNRLLQLDQAIKFGDFAEINGMIVIKNDHLVFENYYQNDTRHDLTNCGKITFGVMILAMDLFIEEGLIQDLSDSIYTYLPEYQTLFDATPAKKSITFLHLLRHESGLVWSEGGTSASDFDQMLTANDWVQYILSKPLETPTPGLRYSENTASGILIAKIMQSQLGQLPLEEFLRDRLFEPLGIRQFNWSKSPQNVLNGAFGLELTLIDITRLGYMMVLEGRWLNKRRIITRDWVFAVSTQQLTVDNIFSYGYGWKILTENIKQTFGVSGNTIYYIDGDEGQGMYVVPEQEMVVTVSAQNNYPNSEYNTLFLFLSLLQAHQIGMQN